MATLPSTSLASLREQLQSGAESLGLHLSETQIAQLLAYLQLFAKWNAAYNLSAVRKVEEMVTRHLLDSLSIVPHLSRDGPWLDVGSGGGLPGIPLAILFADTDLTLLDSNGKKTRFLFQVKTELGLHKLSIVQSRVEAFRPEKPFAAIFSRAFASLKDFLDGCEHLLSDGGRLYAMKGQYPQDELREVQKPFTVEHCYSLNVPGESADRHVVVIKKADGDHYPGISD